MLRQRSAMTKADTCSTNSMLQSKTKNSEALLNTQWDQMRFPWMTVRKPTCTVQSALHTTDSKTACTIHSALRTIDFSGDKDNTFAILGWFNANRAPLDNTVEAERVAALQVVGFLITQQTILCSVPKYYSLNIHVHHMSKGWQWELTTHTHTKKREGVGGGGGGGGGGWQTL